MNVGEGVSRTTRSRPEPTFVSAQHRGLTIPEASMLRARRQQRDKGRPAGHRPRLQRERRAVERPRDRPRQEAEDLKKRAAERGMQRGRRVGGGRSSTDLCVGPDSVERATGPRRRKPLHSVTRQRLHDNEKREQSVHSPARASSTRLACRKTRRFGAARTRHRKDDGVGPKERPLQGEAVREAFARRRGSIWRNHPKLTASS